MLQFIKKYSPDYAKNTFEGWSVVLVVAAGFELPTIANSWFEMFGLFITGVLFAHIIACISKFFIRKKQVINPLAELN